MAGGQRAPASRTLRARLAAALVAAALVFAAVGVAGAFGGSPRSERERVTALEESLRCPTCAAESIADSQAPIAASMRAEVAEQLAAGRSDEEVLAWFEERYGPTVLLSPPVRGVSALVWLLPGVVLGAGVVGVVLQRRRRPKQPSPAPRVQGESSPAAAAYGARGDARLHRPRSGGAERRPAAVAVLLGAGVVAALAGAGLAGAASGEAGEPPTAGAGPAVGAPSSETGATADRAVLDQLRRAAAARGDVELWLALGRAWEERDRLPRAADAYRHAVEAQPEHPTARFLLGFALLRTGDRGEALRILGDLVADHPDHAEALLLLGTARQQQDPAATSTLRRFLEVAPDHPAAPRVRELLRKGGR